MTMSNLLDAFDAALPDATVVSALRAMLRSRADGDVVQIVLGEIVTVVPLDVEICMVTKALFKEYFDIGFGTSYRVQMALGGITKQEHGVLHAGICFSTAYFNADGQLITADFHLEMR